MLLGADALIKAKKVFRPYQLQVYQLEQWIGTANAKYKDAVENAAKAFWALRGAYRKMREYFLTRGVLLGLLDAGAGDEPPELIALRNNLHEAQATFEARKQWLDEFSDRYSYPAH